MANVKVKSRRQSLKKKYVFVNEEDKDVEIEFTWLAPSTEQHVLLQSDDGDTFLKKVITLVKSNLSGPEPYEGLLFEYFQNESNVIKEYTELQELLGKQNLQG